MFRLWVRFSSGSTVSASSDNLVILEAIMRGIEIVNKENPCVYSIAIDGEKMYPFERITDNG